MSYQKIGLMLIFALSIGMFVSCDKDNSQGSAQIEITDAPIDNANVSGAFVTIADIKLDGKSVKGFNKTTVDLMAYQNGSTKLLGNFDLDAETYSSITLVLDHEEDANGASPGCYVLDVNGTKHALATTATEITVNKAYQVTADATTNLVIDFDLRKSIKETGNANDNYDFVTAAELNSSLRLVAKSKAGKIKGNISDNTNSDKIVVYAYKKGTYVRSTETQGQGASNIEFNNAVTSAEVDASGNYTLSFLEEGEYELYYASYAENTSNGKFELQGTLNVNVLSSLDILGIVIGADASITANVTVLGLLPL